MSMVIIAIEEYVVDSLFLGIRGFLGPLYVSCCTSYLTGFERFCIGCRLMVFCMSSNSPGLLMLGGRTCAMIIARQWTHLLQLGDNISASQLYRCSALRCHDHTPQTQLRHNSVQHGQLLSTETAELDRMSSTQSIRTTQRSRFCSLNATWRSVGWDHTVPVIMFPINAIVSNSVECG